MVEVFGILVKTELTDNKENFWNGCMSKQVTIIIIKKYFITKNPMALNSPVRIQQIPLLTYL